MLVDGALMSSEGVAGFLSFDTDNPSLQLPRACKSNIICTFSKLALYGKNCWQLCEAECGLPCMHFIIIKVNRNAIKSKSGKDYRSDVSKWKLMWFLMYCGSLI